MNKAKKKKPGTITFRPGKEDQKAIEGIKDYYGFTQNSGAVRFAIRRFYDNMTHTNPITILPKGK